jgi:hypothetical protein
MIVRAYSPLSTYFSRPSSIPQQPHQQHYLFKSPAKGTTDTMFTPQQALIPLRAARLARPRLNQLEKPTARALHRSAVRSPTQRQAHTQIQSSTSTTAEADTILPVPFVAHQTPLRSPTSAPSIFTPTASTPFLPTKPLEIPYPLSFPASNLSTPDPLRLRATIRFQYYPECARLVREVLGASEAVPFDWSRAPTHQQRGPPSQTSGATALEILSRTLHPDEAACWQAGRWGIVCVERNIAILNGLVGSQTDGVARVTADFDSAPPVQLLHQPADMSELSGGDMGVSDQGAMLGAAREQERHVVTVRVLCLLG